MKKGLLVSLCALALAITPVSATSLTESFDASKSYYNALTELKTDNDVIAMESLGLEAETKNTDEILKMDTSTMKGGTLAKHIIALTLSGHDPRNIDGKNLVTELENCMHEDGTFYRNNATSENYADSLSYAVFAYYMVGSTKLEAAADALSKQQNLEDTVIDYTNFVFSYKGTFKTAYGPDLDTTGFAIEALTLANKTKYQSIIDLALAGIKEAQGTEAEYQNYGAGNADTQGAIIAALATYDLAGVKGTTYNVGDKNPYIYLLTWQNANGAFTLNDWQTGARVENALATYDGTRAVGTYNNGSVFEDAKAEYTALITPKEEPKKEETKQEETEKTDVVQTSDHTSFALPLLGLFISLIIIVKTKRSIIE